MKVFSYDYYYVDLKIALVEKLMKRRIDDE